MFLRKCSWLVGVGIALGGGAGAQAQQAAASPAEAKTCHESAVKVEFGFDSATAAVDTSKVNEVSTWLAGDPGRTVIVKGTTDSSGAPAYNEDLSMRRAQSVQQGLVSQGVDPARVEVIGEGEAPATDAGSARESRSAVVLLCEAPAGAAATAPPAAAAAAAAAPAEAAPPPEGAPPAEPAAPAEEALPEEGPLAEAEPAPEMAMPEPYSEPIPLQEQAPEPSGLERIGLGVALGGGVVDFTDSEARALTDLGGSWELRAIVGARLPLAAELAYTGSAQSIDVLGIGTDSVLLGNGGEVALRLQLPHKYVRPYAVAGVGWTHYQLTNTGGDNTSLMSSDDDVVTVPLGLGLTLHSMFGGTFDVRGTFRAAFQEDLMTGVYAGTGAVARLHTWNVNATLGWEF